MFFTNRLNKLKDQITDEVKKHGSLNLTTYDLIPEYSAVHIPTTNISKIKSFFKVYRGLYGLYWFEILEGLKYYFEVVIDDAESKLFTHNMLDKFREDFLNFQFNDVNTFYVKYHNLAMIHGQKEYFAYEIKLLVEKLHDEGDKASAIQTFESLIISRESQKFIENSPFNEFQLDVLRSELEQISKFSFKTNLNTTELTKPKNRGLLSWSGTDLELSELLKSLLQSNKFVGHRDKEVFETLFGVFGINYSDSIKKERLSTIKARTKDKTPFIDQLSINLQTWIDTKDD